MPPLKLRTKILLSTWTIVLLAGLVIVFMVRSILADRIRAELLKRGVFIAATIAGQSLNPLVTENYVSLRLTLNEARKIDRDIAYIFVHDEQRVVRAHTFPGGFPPELMAISDPARGQPYLVQVLATERGGMEDIAVSIPAGAGTVHVGMTEEPVRRAVDAIVLAIAGVMALIVLLAGAAAMFIAISVIRPLEELSAAVTRVGAGDLKQRLAVDRGDEIGLLTESFNRMVADLARNLEERTRTEAALGAALGALERQYEELRKLDRVKDGLIRDVSHELKTPVAKHAMQLELLKKTFGVGRMPAAALRIIDVMEANIRRQGHVIGGILDLSRLEAGGRAYRREEVRLDLLLDGIIKEHGTLLEAYGIAVTARLEEIALASDQDMLWHVFSNLLTNAIKFRREDRPAIEVSLAREDGGAVIRIRDNGIGMVPQELSRAFERFYQGSPTAEGSGVGLSICRLIVTGLGGVIRLESEGRGRGTVAVVTLPAA